MIWQVSFSQRVTLWILAAGVLIGGGVGVIRHISDSDLQPVNVASAGTPDEVALKKLADSIMHARAVAVAAPININTANAAQFESLKGIGPVLASNIIEYREQHGPFESVDDLINVSGIGPKRLEALRERCVVDSF